MSDATGTFDYIVVGAGSAGCVVATRLSEDPGCRVLLLEGGGDDQHEDVRNPGRWPFLFYGELDWGWRSQPLRSCGGRVDHIPRGKMLGGCHSHNASVWVRGAPADFDHWAYQGCVGWSWRDVAPVFKRVENWQGPPSELRGTGGPLHIEPPHDPNPLATAFLEGAESVGLARLDDINGPDMLGAGYFNFTIKDGRRFSVVDGYLRPALGRANLQVVTRAETDRLLIADGRCQGVEYRHAGRTCRAHAECEVILCAGVIGSPRILLLSGVGPESELQALSIRTVVDLPGVGRNLQDHALLAGLVYECRGELPPLRNNGAEATLWWKSDPRLPAPDTQPVFIEFPFASPELAHHIPHANCYTISPSVVRPASRGSVRLASADPTAAPLIDVNFLSRDADVEALLKSVELCREIGASAAFAPFRAREVLPGPRGRTEMIEFIRNAASTYFHPTSTCRMGVTDECVVDPQLRVYGIAGLRVADASIMPDVTSGNTNAPTVMIGERAVDFIRGVF